MNAPTQCPKCGSPLAPGGRFCGKCGYQAQATASDRAEIGARIGLKHEKQTHQQRIQSGRNTILAVAILAAIGGIVVYFLLSSQVEKNQREIDAARGNPAYDQDKVTEAARDNARAKHIVVLIAAVNGILALCYFGLWIWAKTRPLPATLSALILFITVHVASAVLEPTSLIQGIWLKVIILLFLIKAVDSARKYQKMQEHGV